MRVFVSTALAAHMPRERRSAQRPGQFSIPPRTAAQSGLLAIRIGSANRVDEIPASLKRSRFELDFQRRIAPPQNAGRMNSACRRVEFRSVDRQDSLIVAIAEARPACHGNMLDR